MGACRRGNVRDGCERRGVTEKGREYYIVGGVQQRGECESSKPALHRSASLHKTTNFKAS